MRTKRIINSYQIPNDEFLILLNDTDTSTDLDLNDTLSNSDIEPISNITLNNSVAETACTYDNCTDWSYDEFLNRTRLYGSFWSVYEYDFEE